jgi:ArsR family transcriptional regulator, arsenate/arsenite/antimonite-responsive transcriptional repressor
MYRKAAPLMTTASRNLAPEQVNAAFKALASEQRREILRILATCGSASSRSCSATDEVCACKISDQLGLAPSTISHHMGVLRAAGLVTARKDGTWVHYAIRRDVMREVAAQLLHF